VRQKESIAEAYLKAPRALPQAMQAAHSTRVLGSIFENGESVSYLRSELTGE
jgi:hypothetical protein